MKTCRYIVEIEMPEGDSISVTWLKDLIQADCDVEDKERRKVMVKEVVVTDVLQKAMDSYIETVEGKEAWSDGPDHYDGKDLEDAIRFGAEWMAEQGVSYEATISAHKTIPALPMKDVSDMGLDYGDKVIVQIRKKDG